MNCLRHCTSEPYGTEVHPLRRRQVPTTFEVILCAAVFLASSAGIAASTSFAGARPASTRSIKRTKMLKGASSGRRGTRKAKPASHKKSSKGSKGKLLNRLVRRKAPRSNKTQLSPAKKRNLFRRIDKIVSHFHHIGKGTRVQFTGSFAYAGFTHDIDMRVVGISAEDAIRKLTRTFPELKAADIEEKAPYMEGVRHIQADISRAGYGETQLDISVYESAELFEKPHQWVSFAKVKLEVGARQKASHLLRKIEKRPFRQDPSLVDPSRGGVEDFYNASISIFQEPGSDLSRLPEGILHAMYLVGKPSEFKVERASLEIYKNMDAATLAEFFSPSTHGDSMAGRRFGYILSAFRVEQNRNTRRSLELGRDSTLWNKVIPEMSSVTHNSSKWRIVGRRVEHAKKKAAKNGGSRAYVFGAFLSELSRGQFEAAMARFSIPRTLSDTGISWEQEIRNGYQDYRPQINVPLSMKSKPGIAGKQAA